MTQQLFVNLMGKEYKNEILREGAILSKIVIADGLQIDTPIRIFPDYSQMVIRVVPESEYTPDEFAPNPFDDWVVNDPNSEEAIIWIATKKLGMVSTVKNSMKIIRIKDGFLVALLKGKISVEKSTGEVLELARGYNGSAETQALCTPEQFSPFNIKRVQEGYNYPNYSWNVMLDAQIKQNIYGNRGGFRFEDLTASGFDFRRVDHHLLDADIYSEEFANHQFMMEKLRKEEEAKKLRRKEEEAMWQAERAAKAEEEAKKKNSKTSKARTQRQDITDFLKSVGTI